MNRVSTDLIENAERLLDIARRQGADEAQVTAVRCRTQKVGFERNEVNLASSGEETTYTLKVHTEHRLGSAQTNSPLPDDLARAANGALEVARFAPPDEYLNLPGPQPIEIHDDRFDPEIDQLAPEALRRLAEGYLRALCSDPRLSIDSGNVESASFETCLLNTNGVRLLDRSTQLQWTGSGQAIDGDEITSFDYESGSSFHLRGVAERTREEAARFGNQVLSSFGASRAETYKGLVLLTPKVIDELVLQPLEFHLSGLQVFYGKSSLGDDRLGQRVAHPLFSMLDDPFDLSLSGADPFDGEGSPTRRLELIHEGVLERHIENAYSARRRGRERTGHGGLSLHAPSVAAGTTPLAQLIAQPKPLLSVHRFSGNVDLASGNFSGVAKGSHLYFSAGNRRPVRETMIAGNIFEMLRCIAAVSLERQNVDARFHAPWLLVDGISVTAE